MTGRPIAMWPILRALFARELRLVLRGGHLLPVLAFVFICVMLMPFGLGPELSLLQRLAPGLLWVIMLMAVLLSLDRMFQADFEDGGLDQLLLLPIALEGAVIAKICAHFVGILLPVLAAIPLAGLLLNIHPDAVLPMLATLLAGAPALGMLGAIGAALAVGVRRAGLLTVLIVTPLYVPVLVFGAGGLARALAAPGMLDVGALGVLGLISMASLFLAPPAIAAALRAGLR
jgi:heme exporter protein B